MNMAMYKGEAISGGIGIGELYVLEEPGLSIDREQVEDRRIPDELERLKKAIAETAEEINYLKSGFAKRLKKEERLIFDAFRTILLDDYFVEEVKEMILLQKCNAEYAVDRCIDSYVELIGRSGNAHAARNIFDLKDIGYRIIKNITGGNRTYGAINKISSRSIVAVRQLNLPLAATLAKRNAAGIIAQDGGGYLSHGAIILRSLGMPALSGVNLQVLKQYGRAGIIINGNTGEVLLNPTQEEIDKNHALAKELKRKIRVGARGHMPGATADGHMVRITASAGSFEECDEANDNGLDGIGLLRTEMLFANDRQVPDEMAQFIAYSEILCKMPYKAVIIRTADLGGDKHLEFLGSPNSFLKSGLRGIKYSLLEKTFLINQLRAALRASQAGNIGIAFPVVEEGEELKQVKKIVQKIKRDFAREGKSIIRDVRLGAFVETLKALDNLEEILAEADFISIGTNDLLQQVLGIDREHIAVEKKEYLRPEFLKTVKFCVEKAGQWKKSASVCGEMVSDAGAAVILVGMGARELCVSPSKAGEILAAIKGIHMENAEILAEKAVSCTCVEEVKALLAAYNKQ